MNYLNSLPNNIKILRKFCIRDDLAVADILRASGMDNLSGKELTRVRSELNRIIVSVLGEEAKGANKRRFTGYQIILFSLIQDLYQKRLIAMKTAEDIYRSLTNNSDFDDVEYFIENSMNAGYTKLAIMSLKLKFPLLQVLTNKKVRHLLIGITSSNVSIWGIESSVDRGFYNELFDNESDGTESLSVVDIEKLLSVILKRLSLPNIEKKDGSFRVSSYFFESKTSEMSLNIDELILIEELRKLKNENPQVSKISLTLDKNNFVEEISYHEQNIRKPKSVHSILEDVETASLTSYRDSNGDIRYSRKVKILFP